MRKNEARHSIEKEDSFVLKSQLKGEDEIKKFMLDDRLSNVRNVMNVLSGENQEQKVAILGGLELRNNSEDFYKCVLPKICENLQSTTPAFQQAVADTLSRLFSKHLIEHSLAEKILPLLFKILENQHEDVVQRWSVPFNWGIAEIGWECFQSKYCPTILKRAAIGESTSVRYGASQNIIAAAVILSKKGSIKEPLLPAFLELCSDHDLGIQVSAITSIKFMLPFLSSEFIEAQIAGELGSCLRDPNITIRQLGIEICLKYQNEFSQEFLRQELVPSIMREFGIGKPISSNILLVQYNVIISLLTTSGEPIESFIEPVYKFFDSCLRSDNLDVSRLAFGHIYAIIELLLSKSIDVKYEDEINDRGTQPEYIAVLLESLEQIIKVLLNFDRVKLIYPTFFKILNGKSKKCRIKLICILSNYVGVLGLPAVLEEAKHPSYDLAKKILPSIKQTWEALKCTKWRYKEMLIRVLPKYNCCFSLIEFNDYFLDELLKFLPIANNSLLKPVCETLSQLLIRNYRSEKRNTIFSNLLKMANSMSSFERIAFLSFAEASIISDKSEIIKLTAQLSQDRVLGVVLRFLKIVVSLIDKLREDLQNILISQVKELQSHKKREVVLCAKKAQIKIEKILENNVEIQDRVIETQELLEAEENMLKLKEKEELKQGSKILNGQLTTKKILKAGSARTSMGTKAKRITETPKIVSKESKSKKTESVKMPTSSIHSKPKKNIVELHSSPQKTSVTAKSGIHMQKAQSTNK